MVIEEEIIFRTESGLQVVRAPVERKKGLTRATQKCELWHCLNPACKLLSNLWHIAGRNPYQDDWLECPFRLQLANDATQPSHSVVRSRSPSKPGCPVSNCYTAEQPGQEGAEDKQCSLDDQETAQRHPSLLLPMHIQQPGIEPRWKGLPEPAHTLSMQCSRRQRAGPLQILQETYRVGVTGLVWHRIPMCSRPAGGQTPTSRLRYSCQ